MLTHEVLEQYHSALKRGQKNHKDCVLHGRYPYPQVLDEILDGSMVAGRVDLGLIEIPTDQIVGTKSSGRKSVFAANFMPLLGEDTEFAAKWMELCQAHLGDEGIRDPIRCYEYLGRFYVQEGNKRVSVLKSYDAATIPGYVTRVIPVYTEDPDIRAYYEFLHFYRLSGLYQVYSRRPGSGAKLQAALGFEPDHVWTQAERQSFLSGFAFFREPFLKLGGASLPVSQADAMLVWLKVYPFSFLKASSFAELHKSVAAVWPDVEILAQSDPIAVSTDHQEGDPGILSRIIKTVFPSRLNIAFINESNPERSTWVRAHQQGWQRLEEVFGDKVTVQVYTDAPNGPEAERAMEEAIAQGAQVIFATSPPLIDTCRRIAVLHPAVRVVNCSISMPYTGVRTYYSRIYEGKFISGAIAGAMAAGDKIGYIASAPIFGVPAGINAFALGARLTNPRARVQLKWSCTAADPMGELIGQGVDLVSNRDIPTPDQSQGEWGLCQLQPDGSMEPLASPYWNWGSFYGKMVHSILSGAWDELDAKDEGHAVSYWWGMASGVIDLRVAPALPDGVRQLADILRRGIIDASIYPFHREIVDQAGTLRNDGSRWLSAEEILHMDWLCDCVDGSIPTFDELLPMARNLVRLQGVYRDQIPPEKEGTLL